LSVASVECRGKWKSGKWQEERQKRERREVASATVAAWQVINTFETQ